jgi:hypothetical protein
MKDEKITADVVRERARLAGVSIDEDRIEEIAASMEQALAPLCALDLRATRLVEPAVASRPAWSE